MKTDNKGFSLIDVLVAAVILTIIALPICSGFLMAARQNTVLREDEQVRRTLENLIEEIKSRGVDDNGNTVAVNLSPPEGYKASAERVPSLNDDSKPAYYNISVRYENGTAGDETDDTVLEGVYVP